MICPKCQAKFNGFRMGKEKEQHIIKCGNCDQFLMPSQGSFDILKQKKNLGLIGLGLIYVSILYFANKALMQYSDWYFYSLMIIGAIIVSKIYVVLYKHFYESTVLFEAHDIRQEKKCDIDL